MPSLTPPERGLPALESLVKNALPKRPGGKTSGLVRFLIVCAILAGGAVLTAVVVFSVWRWRLGRSVNTQIASIRAAGLPVNWEDLSKWPVSVPKDKNAAFIYTDAIAQLTDPNAISQLNERSIRAILGIDDVLETRQRLPAKMKRQFELAVSTNRAALDIIEQVTNASESRYPVNYLDGPSVRLPHLAGLKSLSYLIACDAILKIEASNAPAASGDVLSQLNLSRSLDNEPILISQVVSADILTRSCRTLQEILCHTALSEETLSDLESQFTEVEATNRFLTAMIGERALDGEFIRLAQDDPRRMVEISDENSPSDDQSALPRNIGAGWRFIGFFERDRNFYLEGMATDIFFIQQGPPASLAVSDVDEWVSEVEAKKMYIFCQIFLTPAGGIARRDASTRAELRDAIAAIAVEHWRLLHDGTLPDSLSNLVPGFLPAVPTDPFDGKPLRYKKLKKGYCIYSVGPDKQDDGGKELPPPAVRGSFSETTNYDIVFTVER